jgi:hypothetical protein
LIKIHDPEASRICYKDVEANYCMVKTIATLHPFKTPSFYFLADMLGFMDVIFKKQMLRESTVPIEDPLLEAEQKQKLAMREASRLQRLLTHVRYMRRNGDRSRSERILTLKGIIKKRAERDVGLPLGDEGHWDDGRLDLRGDGDWESCLEALRLITSTSRLTSFWISY